MCNKNINQQKQQIVKNEMQDTNGEEGKVHDVYVCIINIGRLNFQLSAKME